ncbi:MAG: hypothetical protein KBS98_09200 [Flavobacterium sp.]|nr:hypothetical protein [Candidatus Neoflavobacterium equi]
MRKILIVAMALSFGSIAQARTVENTTVDGFVLSQDEYKEIEVDKLPTAIQTTLKEKGAEVIKAFVNEEKEYKVYFKVGEEAQTVFYKEDGSEIKK